MAGSSEHQLQASSFNHQFPLWCVYHFLWGLHWQLPNMGDSQLCPFYITYCCHFQSIIHTMNITSHFVSPVASQSPRRPEREVLVPRPTGTTQSKSWIHNKLGQQICRTCDYHHIEKTLHITADMSLMGGAITTTDRPEKFPHEIFKPCVSFHDW